MEETLRMTDRWYYGMKRGTKVLASWSRCVTKATERDEVAVIISHGSTRRQGGKGAPMKRRADRVLSQCPPLPPAQCKHFAAVASQRFITRITAGKEERERERERCCGFSFAPPNKSIVAWHPLLHCFSTAVTHFNRSYYLSLRKDTV